MSLSITNGIEVNGGINDFLSMLRLFHSSLSSCKRLIKNNRKLSTNNKGRADVNILQLFTPLVVVMNTFYCKHDECESSTQCCCVYTLQESTK